MEKLFVGCVEIIELLEFLPLVVLIFIGSSFFSILLWIVFIVRSLKLFGQWEYFLWLDLFFVAVKGFYLIFNLFHEVQKLAIFIFYIILHLYFFICQDVVNVRSYDWKVGVYFATDFMVPSFMRIDNLFLSCEKCFERCQIVDVWINKRVRFDSGSLPWIVELIELNRRRSLPESGGGADGLGGSG